MTLVARSSVSTFITALFFWLERIMLTNVVTPQCTRRRLTPRKGFPKKSYRQECVSGATRNPAFRTAYAPSPSGTCGGRLRFAGRALRNLRAASRGRARIPADNATNRRVGTKTWAEMHTVRQFQGFRRLLRDAYKCHYCTNPSFRDENLAARNPIPQTAWAAWPCHRIFARCMRRATCSAVSPAPSWSVRRASPRPRTRGT